MNQEIAAGCCARPLVKVRTKVPGGPWFVELGQSPKEPVTLGPYDNPANARDDARKLRDYLEAMIRDRGEA